MPNLLNDNGFFGKDFFPHHDSSFTIGIQLFCVPEPDKKEGALLSG